MKMNIKTLFGLAAVAGLLVVAAPSDRAQALSLLNPGTTASAKHASEGLTTEVRWGRHHGWRHRHWHHRRHWR